MKTLHCAQKAKLQQLTYMQVNKFIEVLKLCVMNIAPQLQSDTTGDS